jgi:serine/threonine-protein kinase
MTVVTVLDHRVSVSAPPGESEEPNPTLMNLQDGHTAHATICHSLNHEDRVTMSSDAHFPGARSDRNLLFGILALQMDFVSRDQLIAAMNGWILDKTRALGQVLQEQGALTEADRSLLETIVVRHLEKHGYDTRKSLAAVAEASGPAISVRSGLECVADADLQASVACLASRATPGLNPAEAADETAPAETAAAHDGRFQLLRLHDRGGLGEVYLALDRELNRQVALKRIKAEHADNPEGRARFVVEAEITGNLEHPGVVPVYSLGHGDSGQPYYAMRFIKGDNLRHAADQFHEADAAPGRDPGKRALELRRLLGRFLDVCNAIEYAHSRGVLHRDIKPSNVMLGKYGETLVVDWGLAKSVGRPDHAVGAWDAEGTLAPGSGSSLQPTLTGARLGTPAYMSPEQAAGMLDRMGPASDVYSLGATLYYLLTGKTPFEGPDLPEVLSRVERGDFTPPRQVKPRVDAALESICLKAMAQDPTQRYATARALSDDVEHWLADEPVGAHREGLGVRLRRWGRRHRPLVAGLAGLLVMAVVALSAGTVLLGQANRRTSEQRDEAQRQRDEAQRQRDLARQNFDRARGAVNTFLTRFSEDRLLNQPGMQPLRKQLMAEALLYYQDFIKQRADDPSLQREMAEACRRAGEITGEIGSPDEAITVLEKGVALFEPLLTTAPDDRDLRMGLGRSYQMMGLCHLHAGRGESAERALRAAIALYAPLEASTPEVSEYGRRLGRCYDLLGVVGLVSGRYRDYEPYWDQAAEVLKRTIARHPDDVEARSQEARIYSNNGESLGARDDRAGQVARLRRAAEISRLLCQQDPDHPLVRRDLAMVLCNMGRAETAMGQLRAGERHIEEGDAVLRPILTNDPSVTDYWKRLLELVTGHVEISSAMERMAACEGYVQAARRIVSRIEETKPLDQFERMNAADIHTAYGQMLALRQRWTQALTALESALAARAQLVHDYPGIWAEVGKLFAVRSALAEVRLRLGQLKLPEALSALQGDLRGLEALVAKQPYPALSHIQSEVLLRLARGQLEAGQVPESRESVRRSVQILNGLMKDHPERHNFRLTLGRAVAVRGELELKDGRVDAAIGDARGAVELLEPLVAEGSGYAFELGCFQAAYRDLAEAHPTAKAQRVPDSSVCLGTLKKAIEDGCDNVDALRIDPRLAGLRTHSNFAKLIDRATATASAAAAHSAGLLPSAKADSRNGSVPAPGRNKGPG